MALGASSDDGYRAGEAKTTRHGSTGASQRVPSAVITELRHTTEAPHRTVRSESQNLTVLFSGALREAAGAS